MKSTPKGFTDLMMRSMVVPEEVDIRNYQVISFKGKLKKLTGTKNTPYKMISLPCNSRVITIQVFFIKEERKAFINKLIYEKYRSEIANYFSSKPEEKPAALVNNNNGEKKFTDHNPQTNDKDKDSQECEYDKKHIESTNDAGNYSNIKWQHLRDYLLSDFGERKYKRKSIIDIYC